MSSAISIAVDFVRYVLRQYSDVVDAVATRGGGRTPEAGQSWPTWCAYPHEVVLEALDQSRPDLSADDRSETAILIATALAWTEQCILLDFSEAALRRIENENANVSKPTPVCPTELGNSQCVFIDGKNILTIEQVRCVGHFISFDFHSRNNATLIAVTLTANEKVTGVMAVPTLLPLNGQSVRAAAEHLLRKHTLDVLDDDMSAFAVTVAELTSKLLDLLRLAGCMPTIDVPAPVEKVGRIYLPTGAICVSVRESSRHLH